MVRHKGKRPTGLCPAGQLFVKLLTQRERLRFPESIAREIWYMISSAEDAEAQAFVYNTSKCLASLQCPTTQDAVAVVEAYFNQWLVPSLIEGAVDELEQRGEIPAQVAERLRDRVDQWSTPHGEWLW
jgi:hypothetical protein